MTKPFLLLSQFTHRLTIMIETNSLPFFTRLNSDPKYNPYYQKQYRENKEGKGGFEIEYSEPSSIFVSSSNAPNASPSFREAKPVSQSRPVNGAARPQIKKPRIRVASPTHRRKTPKNTIRKPSDTSSDVNHIKGPFATQAGRESPPNNLELSKREERTPIKVKPGESKTSFESFHLGGSTSLNNLREPAAENVFASSRTSFNSQPSLKEDLRVNPFRATPIQIRRDRSPILSPKRDLSISQTESDLEEEDRTISGVEGEGTKAKESDLKETKRITFPEQKTLDEDDSGAKNTEGRRNLNRPSSPSSSLLARRVLRRRKRPRPSPRLSIQSDSSQNAFESAQSEISPVKLRPSPAKQSSLSEKVPEEAFIDYEWGQRS